MVDHFSGQFFSLGTNSIVLTLAADPPKIAFFRLPYRKPHCKYFNIKIIIAVAFFFSTGTDAGVGQNGAAIQVVLGPGSQVDRF